MRVVSIKVSCGEIFKAYCFMKMDASMKVHGVMIRSMEKPETCTRMVITTWENTNMASDMAKVSFSGRVVTVTMVSGRMVRSMDLGYGRASKAIVTLVSGIMGSLMGTGYTDG